MEQEKVIRFIDSNYNELFRIPDGADIIITCDGSSRKETCKYQGEYHVMVGYRNYHICEFAEIMERNGATYVPADQIKEIISPAMERQGR